MYTVIEYRRGSLVFQRRSDKFIHSHKLLIWKLFIIYSRAILCTSVEATNKHVLKEENDLSFSHSDSVSTFSPLSLTQTRLEHAFKYILKFYLWTSLS